jgi:hypothetical protein
MKRLIAGILLIIILLAGLFGCSKSSEVKLDTAIRSAPTTTVTYAPSGKGVPAPVTNVPAPTITIAAPATAAGTTYSEIQTASSDRMIIRTANIALVVTDVNAVMGKITNLAASYGGFVVNSNVQENQNLLYGNISVRVLSERFSDALGSIRAMAEDVRSESTSGQDVTDQYSDLSANLRNLEAAEAQLLKLMDRAGNVTDILAVQQELVKTRGQIEQAKGRMQYLEQSSAMSLIQVTLEQSKLTLEFNASIRNIKEGESIRLLLP